MPSNYVRDHRISAMVLEKEDGQEWDDIVNVPLTIEGAHALLAGTSIAMREVMSGIDDAKDAASNGDPIAALVIPHLYDSAKNLQTAMRDIVKVVMPTMWRELEALDAADEAEEAQRTEADERRKRSADRRVR